MLNCQRAYNCQILSNSPLVIRCHKSVYMASENAEPREVWWHRSRLLTYLHAINKQYLPVAYCLNKKQHLFRKAHLSRPNSFCGQDLELVGCWFCWLQLERPIFPILELRSLTKNTWNPIWAASGVQSDSYSNPFVPLPERLNNSTAKLAENEGSSIGVPQEQIESYDSRLSSFHKNPVFQGGWPIYNAQVVPQTSGLSCTS